MMVLALRNNTFFMAFNVRQTFQKELIHSLCHFAETSFGWIVIKTLVLKKIIKVKNQNYKLKNEPIEMSNIIFTQNSLYNIFITFFRN